MQINMKNLTITDKEVLKAISSFNHYTTEQFIKDGFEWIKAIKERRTFATIPHVSNSGMSRVIKYNTCMKYKGGFSYRAWICFIGSLGYKEHKNYWGGFVIGGCGMDMNFHFNYCIIHKLHSLGFITKKQCAVLAQQTPTVL